MIYKKLGFTPLQVLEEVRPFLSEEDGRRLTFAGRLDPMAEGNIHLLWSGDMEEKKRLMAQDKEYMVEVLFGVKTDTDDILGLTTSINEDFIFDEKVLEGYVGPFIYDYPTYSSPHIKKVLKGESVIHKKQEGCIYGIENLGMKTLLSSELQRIIVNKLEQCEMKGEFRLAEIGEGWNNFFKNNINEYQVLTLKVTCKSGTYMRVLARELGGLALSIVRE